MTETVWYHPRCNVIGVVCGIFIEFMWNGQLEDSYFPVLLDEGEWVYIGEL